MATASKGIDEEILNCSICLGQFVAPKYLPCLHTFCEACLQTYISAEIGKGNSDSFQCPICRAPVKPVNAHSPAEKWAEMFPNNHLITSLLDDFSQTKSDQSCGRNCEPCKEGDEENIATYWCMECVEGLCESCASSHRRMKALKNHEVVPINEIDKGSLKMADFDEPCHKHNGKLFEVYCIDHSELCCVICLATNHRKCVHIKTIDEMAEKLVNTEEIIPQLEEVEKHTKKLQDGKQQNIDGLDKKCTDIVASAAVSVNSAKIKLDQLLEKFTEDLQHMHKSERQNLIDKKERIESFGKTVTNGKRMLDTVAKKGSPKQLFVTNEKIKSQLSGHTEQLKHDLKDDSEIDYDLIVSKFICDILATVKLKSTPCPSEMKSLYSAVQICCNMHMRPADINDITVVKVADIISEGSYFTGGSFLHDGNIVFADTAKSQLKIYDITGKIIKSHKLNKPVVVDVWSQEEICVSHCDGFLRIYKLGDELCCLKQVQISHGNQCICKAGDDIILSSLKKVQIIDQSGKSVANFPRVSGAAYPHVAALENNFYYSDKNDIVSSSFNGEEIFRHQIPFLKDNVVLGIALNNRNVFVCCFSSGIVYVISEDGTKGKELLRDIDGIENPVAIGFDRNGEYFFVTSYRERVAAQIYKLVHKHGK